METICGIYQIRNTVTNETYIGQSQNIMSRWAHHLSCLRRGKHHAYSLQESFKFYGEAAFVIEVVEKCDEVKLTAREAYWMAREGPQLNTQHRDRVGNPEFWEARKTKANEAREEELRVAQANYMAQFALVAKCRHCKARITGKKRCIHCDQIRRSECEECHNELRHGMIEVGTHEHPGVARLI